jgi:hypothetical protein
MCAAARVKNHPLVFQIAAQALAEGLWYGEMMWRTDRPSRFWMRRKN